MLDVGTQIPAVTVHGEEGEPVELRGLAADGPLLLAFYLFDWTRPDDPSCGSCVTGARSSRSRGLSIFGISRDSPYSHEPGGTAGPDLPAAQRLDG